MEQYELINCQFPDVYLLLILQFLDDYVTGLCKAIPAYRYISLVECKTFLGKMTERYISVLRNGQLATGNAYYGSPSLMFLVSLIITICLLPSHQLMV